MRITANRPSRRPFGIALYPLCVLLGGYASAALCDSASETAQRMEDLRRTFIVIHVEQCKTSMPLAQATIKREQRIGEVSGYVDKQNLHDAGETIVACQQAQEEAHRLGLDAVIEEAEKEAEKKKREEADQHAATAQASVEELAKQQAGDIQNRHKIKSKKWGDQIAEIVRRHWQRPTGSPPDFSCLVKVQLLPGGSLASVKVVKTCGGGIALDDSVEKAVLRSDPLPMPENPDDFDRNLTFAFNQGSTK